MWECEGGGGDVGLAVGTLVVQRSNGAPHPNGAVKCCTRHTVHGARCTAGWIVVHIQPAKTVCPGVRNTRLALYCTLNQNGDDCSRRQAIAADLSHLPKHLLPCRCILRGFRYTKGAAAPKKDVVFAQMPVCWQCSIPAHRRTVYRRAALNPARNGGSRQTICRACDQAESMCTTAVSIAPLS